MLLHLHHFKADQKKVLIFKVKGLVVQLVRMPACHAGGRRFEPGPDRTPKTKAPL